jgi:tetratricopeptide (TPR) repeat protein
MAAFIPQRRSTVPRRCSGKFFPNITLVISLIAMLALCFCGKQETPRTESNAEPPGGTVCAVMFFQNQEPNPGTDWIGRGIAQLLTLRLSQHDSLTVVRPARLEAFLRIMGLQDSTRLSDQSLVRIAQRIEADRAVLGDYRLADDRFLIDVRLVDVADGSVLTEEQVDGAGSADLFRLTAEIAGTLEKGLDISVAPGIADSRPTDDLDAYESFIRGLEAFRRFDTSEGMAYLRTAVSRDTAFTLAYAAKSLQAFSIGDLSRAQRATIQTLLHPEQLPGAERFLVQAVDLQFTRKYDESFQIMQQVEKTTAWDPEILLVLAQMYCLVKDYDQAEKVYQSILRSDSNNVTALFMLGLAQQQLGQLDMAQSTVSEAIRLRPDNPHSHLIMSRIFIYQKNREAAEEELRKISDLNVRDPWIHNELGYLYQNFNKSALALQEFQRYVQLAPDDPNAYDSLGDGYRYNGQDEKAEEQYLHALKMQPSFAKAYYKLGAIYEKRGESERAVKMFQKYLQLSPRGSLASWAEQKLAELHEE